MEQYIKLDYNIIICDNNVHVDGTINIENSLLLELVHNNFVNSSSERITKLRFFKDDYLLNFISYIDNNNLIIKIFGGQNCHKIRVSYDIDLCLKQGRRGKFLGGCFGDYGYFNMKDVLLLPMSINEYQLSVCCILEKSWECKVDRYVYRHVGRKEYAGYYVAFFKNADNFVINDIISVIYKEENKIEPEIISECISAVKKTLLFDIGNLERKIYIVPSDKIHGGISTNESIVCENDIQILCHEIIHWWIGHTIKFSDDAYWIKEGAVVYYSLYMLLLLGIINIIEYKSEILNYIGCISKEQIDLREESLALTKDRSPQAYNNVYYGGAVWFFSLNEYCKNHKISWESIWRILHEKGVVVSTRIFLDEMKRIIETYNR